MSWDQIVGHENALTRFRRSIDRDRLASTYLLVGPEGIGKRTFALKLAESILCETNPIQALEPCGNCPGCLQVQNQTHPDLLQVVKPADKSILPVDLFIGPKDKRRRQGLVYEIGLKPFRGGHRIAIIDDADFFNAESANSLLKTLEEPPPNSLIMLLGTSEQRQLQTIVSRSQIVRFNALNQTEVLDVLQRSDAIDQEMLGERSLEELARLSNGQVSRAMQLANPDVYEFRLQLFKQLASGDPGANGFNSIVIAFADSAGKEMVRKRPQYILAGDFAIDFYQACYRRLIGDDPPNESIDESAVASLVQRYAANPDLGAELIGKCILRTTEMHHHVRANAGAPNIVDSWLIDLGRLGRGEIVTTGQTLRGVV